MSVEQFIYFLLGFAIVFDAAIAWYVLVKQPRRAVNQAYFVFILCITAWQITYFVRSYVFFDDAVAYLILSRLALAIALVLVAVLLYFVTIYPAGSHRPSLILALAIVVLPGASFAFSEPVIRASSDPGVEFGAGYPLVVGAIFLLLVTALALLIYRWVEASDMRTKIQFQYLTLGLSVPVIFGGFNTIYLPFQAFSDGATSYLMSTLQNIGPASTMFLSLVAGYSILRHRLMGIRVLLYRNSIVLLTSVLLFCVLLAGLVIFQPVFGVRVGSTHVVLIAGICLTVVLVFGLLQPLIRGVVRRGMRRGAVDLRQWTPDEQHLFARTETPEKLGRVLASNFMKHIPVEQFVVLTYDHYQECCRTVYPQSAHRVCAMDEPWVTGFVRAPQVVHRGQLQHRFAGAELRAITKVFTALQAEWVVPLSAYGRFVGMIFIGSKTDAKPFNAADQQYLLDFQSLASTSMWSVLQIHHVVRTAIDTID